MWRNKNIAIWFGHHLTITKLDVMRYATLSPNLNIEKANVVLNVLNDNYKYI